MRKVAFVIVIVTVCAGQVGPSSQAGLAGNLQLIRRILLAGHVFGSIAYSGCGFDKRVPPDLPPFGALDESGSPKEVLTKRFSVDPLMQVTQDEPGIVRMSERNVPIDLLKIKIHHLEFLPATVSESLQSMAPELQCM